MIALVSGVIGVAFTFWSLSDWIRVKTLGGLGDWITDAGLATGAIVVFVLMVLKLITAEVRSIEIRFEERSRGKDAQEEEKSSPHQ